MADHDPYHWSVPFRGHFVRAVLADAGKSSTEGGDAATAELMVGAVEDTPVPFMGPPLPVDRRKEVPVTQTPAIVPCLGGMPSPNRDTTGEPVLEPPP